MRTRTRTRRHVAAMLLVPVVASVLAATPGTRLRTGVVGDAAVASVSPLASQVGIDVLEAGGNAVDAAVATVLAVGVVRPEMCGIGGGGFLVHRSADGDVHALDFREEAPAGHVHGPGVAEAGVYAGATGRNRVGVPGTVAGMDAALRRLGTRSLRELVVPAIALARDGFPVSPDLSLAMAQHAPRLQLYPETARQYLAGGVAPYPPGATLRLPALADDLETIRRGGARAFYTGAMARRVVATLGESSPYAGDESAMGTADLATYRTLWRAPLVGTYRDREVVTMPAPTSGGLAVIETLNLLEGFPLGSGGWEHSGADALHALAESQKIAWADRNAYVADPDVVEVPVEMMTSKAYAAERRTEIDMTKAAAGYEPGDAGRSWPSPDDHREPGQTTHVSVVDSHGNAVAVTCTIEMPFGSAVVADGTGFLLNGQLGDFGADGTANAPAGRKRPRSSLAPTIVVRGGRVELVLGAAGGPRIPLAVVQVISNVVDHGLSPALALDAERVDARRCEAPVIVLCGETARIPATTQIELTRRGHTMGWVYCGVSKATGETGRCDEEYHPFAEVQLVAATEDGRYVAISDPRGEDGAAATGTATGRTRGRP